MKRYNLSQIMKEAHHFFRSNSRMGRTFGECLKLAWRWAKDAIKFKKEREAKAKAMLANYKRVERTSYNDSKITWSDCYNVNSITFGGRSIYGLLIDFACQRYGWTLDYVLWEISLVNLNMLMTDAITTVYLSDEERKKQGLRGGEVINADDPRNRELMREHK